MSRRDCLLWPAIRENQGTTSVGQSWEIFSAVTTPCTWSSYLDNHDDNQLSYRCLTMNNTNTDVIQGTLDMLILKTLSLEPMHGFGIARRIEQITQNVFKVNAGSLLTALQRLERSGWLDADWQVTENSRRAKVYRLTQTGGRQLQSETADWQRRSAAISRLLKAES
jgi:PadR family transcriptional regulator PadR